MKRLLIMVLVFAFAAEVFAQDVTLRWRTRPDNQAEIDVYQNASETIDNEFEGVTLQYEPGGSESASYQDVLVTEIEAGTAPDVFWIPGTDVARFAEAGLILNLNEYSSADSDFSADDFYAGPMEFLTTGVRRGPRRALGHPARRVGFCDLLQPRPVRRGRFGLSR